MIESYPFFVTKNDESFRFQFIPSVTHDIIHLEARSDSVLDWHQARQKLEECKSQEKKVLIKLDLGLEETFNFDNEFLFKSYILAVTELNNTILQNYSDLIEGVIFYKGSLDLVSKCPLDVDSITSHLQTNLIETFPLSFCHNIAACCILGQLLHRLVSFLKDDVPCFVVFEDAEMFNPLEKAILLSKERFDHLFIVASIPEYQYTTLDFGRGYSLIGYMADSLLSEPESVTKALLLPSDEYLNSSNFSKIKSFMDNEPGAYRLITEKIFNECWNEIETVYYDSSSIHPMTARMVKGFIASGGDAQEL